jgi:hypothetical protein
MERFAGGSKTFGQGPSEIGAGSPAEQVKGAFLDTAARHKNAFQVTAVPGTVPYDDFFPVAVYLNRDGQFFFHGFSFLSFQSSSGPNVSQWLFSKWRAEKFFTRHIAELSDSYTFSRKEAGRNGTSGLGNSPLRIITL